MPFCSRQRECGDIKRLLLNLLQMNNPVAALMFLGIKPLSKLKLPHFISIVMYWVFTKYKAFSSVQFSSVAQSCPTLCDPMNRSTPGLPVHHQLPEFTQTHIHRVSDAIQQSHPWSSPSPPAPNPSHHQSLFQWVNSSHEVAKS